MQEYEKITIKEVVEEINERYFLPDIQRPYVWKESQVYALYDSIMRGYPISTFLFWVGESDIIDKLTFKYEFLSDNSKGTENVRSTTTPIEKYDYRIVLDGQQRLTTLYLTLKRNFAIRDNLQDLYFNILSGETEDDYGNLFEFKFFKIDYNYGNIFYDTKNEKLWINIKYLYSIDDEDDLGDSILDYVDSETDIDLSRKEKKYSKILWRLLRKEKLINYYPETYDKKLDEDKQLSRVLDIFVRMNSGGTILSKSDLLFSNLKKGWSEARNEFKNLLSKINGDNVYIFSNDFILKTCLFLFAKSSSDIKYSVKNSEKQVSNIQSEWENITSAIKITRDLLQDFGLTAHKLILSYNALIPIIYFIYKNDLKLVSPVNKLLIKQWLIKVLLNKSFGGQADTMLYINKSAIDKNSADGLFPNQAIIDSVAKKRSFFSIEDLLDKEKIKYESKESYLILSLIDSDVNFNPSSKTNLPQQDHIFSQSELTKNKISKEMKNSIFNLGYLSAIENQQKSDEPVESWLNRMSNKDREKYLIPDGKWKVEDYEQFLKERKKLFIQKLRKLI